VQFGARWRNRGQELLAAKQMKITAAPEESHTLELEQGEKIQEPTNPFVTARTAARRGNPACHIFVIRSTSDALRPMDKTSIHH
jgi:hypothetical protein